MRRVPQARDRDHGRNPGSAEAGTVRSCEKSANDDLRNKRFGQVGRAVDAGD
jgi:hypothetical protein